MPKNKNKTKIAAIALLCALAVVYVGYHIASIFKDEANLFLVEPVTEYNTLDVSGCIFRDETVIYAASGGICAYTHGNGEKVAKDSTLANTYFVDSDDLAKKIKDLNYRIDVLEDSNGRKSLAQLDKQIEECREKIASNLAWGNTSFAQSAEKELLVLLHERALVEKNNDDYSSEITLLKTERTLLLSSLSTSSVEITAENSGYFYSYTDGYETIFTRQAAKELTIESYNSLIRSNSLSGSAAIGKIATSYKWYFACSTTVQMCEQIVADKTYSITFIDNAYSEPVTLLAEKKITDTETGEALLVFSSSTLPRNFDFSRFQRAQVTVEEVKGLRIPSSSVRVFDGQTGVYVIKEGVCRIRKIDILFEKDGYCIAAEGSGSGYISRYDRIILGDNELYDGKVID